MQARRAISLLSALFIVAIVTATVTHAFEGWNEPARKYTIDFVQPSLYAQWRARLTITVGEISLQFQSVERFDNEYECLKFLRSDAVHESIEQALVEVRMQGEAEAEATCVQGEPA